MYTPDAPRFPRRSFLPLRPQRLHVASALTSVDDLLAIERWKSGYFAQRLDVDMKQVNARSFERYDVSPVRKEVSLIEELHRSTRRRRNGWWASVDLSVWDIDEAMETLATRQLLPTENPRRCLAAYCETCGGRGYVNRAACAACDTCRVGTRRRGRGYRVNIPGRFERLNDLAQWACFGAATIVAAEGAVAELIQRINTELPVALRVNPEEHLIAWLPVSPDDWYPLAASATSRTRSILELMSVERDFQPDAFLRACHFRANKAARQHFNLPLCTRWMGNSPDPLAPLADLHNLGFALHDIHTDKQQWMAVVAYPTYV